MIMAKLKTAKGRKFLLCLLGVFIIAASVVTRATIGGVIEQYDIPLSDWTASNVRHSICNDLCLQHGVYDSVGYPAWYLFPRR